MQCKSGKLSLDTLSWPLQAASGVQLVQSHYYPHLVLRAHYRLSYRINKSHKYIGVFGTISILFLKSCNIYSNTTSTFKIFRNFSKNCHLSIIMLSKWKGHWALSDAICFTTTPFSCPPLHLLHKIKGTFILRWRFEKRKRTFYKYIV